MRYTKIELETSQGNEGTTPGVFGTAWYLPAQEVAIQPGPNPLDRSDEQWGVEAALPVAQNEFTPTGSARMRHYPNYLGVFLLLLFGDVTTIAGAGAGTLDPDGVAIPAGAFKHTFVKTATETPKSARATLAYGEEWFQARGVTARELAFALGAEGIEVTAALMANYVSRLVGDPGFVPAQDAFSILPFRRRNVILSWGEGDKNIESVGFTLAQDLEYVRDMGIATGWPTDTERANSPQGRLRLTGNMTRRSIDDQDWEYLLAERTFGVTIKMLSEQNIGATTKPYGMWIQSPDAQLTDGTLEALKNQPRHEANLDWHAPWSQGAGYDFRVTLVNGVAAYK